MNPGPATIPDASSPGRLGRVLAVVFAAVAVLATAGAVFVSSAGRSPAPAGAPAAAAGAAAGTAVGNSGSVGNTGSSGSAAHSGATVTGSTPKPPAGLPRVLLTSLPPEAQRVVAAIDRGGPFRYRQDGVTFANRERRLPAEPRGYYREYTVDTPGSPDRGPRRIIAGRNGELYYTPDHYLTFRWIIRDGGTA